MNSTNGQDGIYPTRGQEERLIERKDPIFYGYQRMPDGLNYEQLNCYEKRGFVIIPNAFSKSEVSDLYDDVRLELKKRKYCYVNGNGRNRPNSKNLFDIHKMSERFLKVSQKKKIVNKIKQVLGSEVYLHQSQVNIADETTGISYPWHAQFEKWHAEYGIPRMRCMEAWLMLTDNTVHNGAMHLLDKSHQIFVACKEAGGPSRETLTRLLGFGGVTNAYETAGTLLLCDSNLMCGATESVVSSKRAIAMFSYNSMENLPHSETLPWTRPQPIPTVARRSRQVKHKRRHAA